MTTPPPNSRTEQRQRTEARILDAAAQTFFAVGYERATIRTVASAAGVDAGLVMHYFGSKDLLFARAAEVPADELPSGSSHEVAEALLTSLGRRLTGEPTASLAVLRSMLTNADAADRYRAAGEPQLNQLTEAIPTSDAALRASLLSAIVHGVIAERYLLRLTHLADASPEQIIDLLRPCFQSLAAPPPTDPADVQQTDRSPAPI